MGKDVNAMRVAKATLNELEDATGAYLGSLNEARATAAAQGQLAATIAVAEQLEEIVKALWEIRDSS